MSAKWAEFRYNGLGQFVRIERGTGVEAVVASTYQYDAVGRLVSLAHQLGDGEAASGAPNDVVAGYGFAYDAASRITGFTVTDRPDESAAFSYDDSNQLTAADRTTADESYAYDANGNRDSAGYTTDAHNRTTSDGTFTYTYDAEGNRTSKTRISSAAADDHAVEYLWDHRNRLTTVVFKNNAGETTKSVAYQYDVFDHVVGKLLDTLVAQTAERYAYDDNQIVLSLNGDVGDPLTLDRRYLWGPQIDQLLAQENVQQAIGSTLRTYWTLNDHQQTVRDLLDAVGFVEAHFGYDSFGRLTLAVDGANDPLTNVAALTYILYTARLYDADTGLQNNHHRWYDNRLAKWTSEDPIGFAASDCNLFRYVANAPWLYTDDDGLKTKTIRAVAKSFIDNIYTTGGVGHFPDSTQGRSVHNAALGAFALFTRANFVEHPRNDRNDGQNRLFTQLNISVDYSENTIIGTHVSTIKNGGTEPGGFKGTIDISVTTTFVDENTVEFSWFGWGRPDPRVEQSFQSVAVRHAKDIWHLGTITLSVNNCNLDIDNASLRGSNFPSHKLWVDGKDRGYKQQGEFTSLWRSDPRLGMTFVSEDGMGPYALQPTLLGPVNWNVPNGLLPQIHLPENIFEPPEAGGGTPPTHPRHPGLPPELIF